MSNELQSTRASRVCSTFAAVASNLFLAVVCQIFPLCLYIASCKEMRLGMN